MRDIKLLTLNSDNSISINLKEISTVQGTENLVQKIVKCLLTSKHSNIFIENYGSQFNQIHLIVDKNLIDRIKQFIPLIIDDITEQIKKEQAQQIINGIEIPNNELLESIEIESIDYDQVFNIWLIKLNINTKSSNINISI